jgi:hypothetical protein
LENICFKVEIVTAFWGARPFPDYYYEKAPAWLYYVCYEVYKLVTRDRREISAHCREILT